ncbi:hypothetical protein BDW22DRAFT_36569 [Trametopsis cervina]|nr:hypothetical protein BDW22DRAFT_36569 [Trametopsis cervina]
MEFKLQRAEAALKKSSALIDEEAKATGNKRQSKDRMGKILNCIQQVTVVFEGFSEINPIAKSVVTVCKAVIKLEVDRRENNVQIVVVCHTMATMIYTLHYYLNLGASQEREDLVVKLHDEMQAMTEVMNRFGDFTDLYYTKCKSTVVRFLRSGDFKEQLRSFTAQFTELRRRVEFLLNVRSAGALLQADMNVQQVLNNTNMILERLGMETALERKKAAPFVARHGGNDAIIEDSAAVKELAKLLKDNEVITSTTLRTLRESIEALLLENRAQFDLKMNGAKMEINEAIARSTDTIIRKLDSGPHDLIQDPDVREIWKANKWRMTVKVRYFVDALCDYFDTKFRREAQFYDGEVPLDSWTLKVISKVIYHPSIGEAIDEDGSGFISIHEVNHFLLNKPEDLSVLLWFTYWAVGWHYMNFVYTASIIESLEVIEEKCEELKNSTHNDDLADCVEEYMVTIKLLRSLIDWPTIVGDSSGLEDLDQETGSELEAIATDLAEKDQAKMRTNLENLEYSINDPALLTSIVEKPGVRIEQVILPFLNVILQEHEITIEDGEHSTPDQAEEFGAKVQNMDMTLTILLYEYHDRMKSLLRSWRSQKQDIQLQVQCYAGGLYAGWYAEYSKPGSDLKRLLEQDEDEGDDDNQANDAPAAEEPPTNDPTSALAERVDQLDIRLENIEAVLRQILSLIAPSSEVEYDDTSYDDPSDPAEQDPQDLYHRGPPAPPMRGSYRGGPPATANRATPPRGSYREGPPVPVNQPVSGSYRVSPPVSTNRSMRGPYRGGPPGNRAPVNQTMQSQYYDGSQSPAGQAPRGWYEEGPPTPANQTTQARRRVQHTREEDSAYSAPQGRGYDWENGSQVSGGEHWYGEQGEEDGADGSYEY